MSQSHVIEGRVPGFALMRLGENDDRRARRSEGKDSASLWLGAVAEGGARDAKEKLTEIAERCGGSCDEYDKLEQAIVTFVTGEPSTSSWWKIA
jgi:hypothetical protein